jgi:N4-gp56 family major capsid protein
MATNVASQFNTGVNTTDVEAFIADELLPLARRHLVAYRFGDPLTLPKGRGTTYTATRYNRLVLPFAPLSEGTPPIGETMTLTQVSATALQWGDKVTITDVAELTIKHPLFNTAMNLMGLQIGETLDRNTFNTWMAFTQVNYVNTRGARVSLVAGDVMNPHEINRISGALYTLGAPRFMGDETTNIKVDPRGGEPKAGKTPRSNPHYVAICHPLVEQDLRENSSIVTAWSYSEIDKLYNDELGEWGGLRFCRSNLVPTFTGVTALAAGSAVVPGTSGNLLSGTYSVQLTMSDMQNQYESRIWAITAGIAVVGPTGSISVTVPNTPGFTANIYVSLVGSATPVNLGISAAGPTSGPMVGQAVQIPASGQTVVISGIGLAQVPPAAPGNLITVYPTFVFGKGAFGQVMLDDVRTTYLTNADKFDPLNQLRVMGWKCFYGTIILNQLFAARIESVSAFSTTFG